MLQSFARWFRRPKPSNYLARRRKFLQVEHLEAREVMASLVATAGMTISESGLVMWTPTNVRDHAGISPAWAHWVSRFSPTELLAVAAYHCLGLPVEFQSARG